MSDPIKLCLDEDSMRASMVRELRARQIDVTTALEAGLVGCSDEVNLAYATNEKRVLFSFNRGDFVRLHKDYLANGRDHGGIIVSAQLGTGIVLRCLFKLVQSRSAKEMQNWLEFLSNWR